ncbi:3-oxoacyl-[acyl-carrier-protein] synthase [Ceratobasidium sp. 423]|nr:3-oxoacyl-[acyl-carrier-protein] synthase [Ceratobasidium sp. 423]
MDPAKRLGSEAEAKSWLDSVATEYARQAGVTLSSGGGGGSATAGGGAITNSEEFLKSQAEQQLFAAQHFELYMRYLRRDSCAGARAYGGEEANATALQAKPTISPRGMATHTSKDALLMWYDIIFGRLTTVDREIASCCITIMNCANPALLSHVQCHNDNRHPEKGETDALAK